MFELVIKVIGKIFYIVGCFMFVRAYLKDETHKMIYWGFVLAICKDVLL